MIAICITFIPEDTGGYEQSKCEGSPYYGTDDISRFADFLRDGQALRIYCFLFEHIFNTLIYVKVTAYILLLIYIIT